jgi:hypothetical protein
MSFVRFFEQLGLNIMCDIVFIFVWKVVWKEVKRVSLGFVATGGWSLCAALLFEEFLGASCDVS